MSAARGAALRDTDMPRLLARGKVRDVYDLGDALMIVATDRISAFDVVMREPVPGKGRVLTALTLFWLRTLPAAAPHHLISVVDQQHCPAQYAAWHGDLADRSMIVRKATVLPVECVVRGYLAGSGWKDYQASGTVSGVPLPPGLQLAQRLAAPIFTPSTKASHGHDEPVSLAQARDIIAASGVRTPRGLTPASLLAQVQQRSIALYQQAAEHCAARGVILADTKFEFGVAGDELLLVDEVLTPDSSRFWPVDSYRPGVSPPSFDKQYLRDYLEQCGWNKQPPPPPLPELVLHQTAERYAEALQRLTTG